MAYIPITNAEAGLSVRNKINGVGQLLDTLILGETPANIQFTNDTDVASATNVGVLRYYESGSNSYVDMCMRTGVSSYAWVNIVQNNWG